MSIKGLLKYFLITFIIFLSAIFSLYKNGLINYINCSDGLIILLSELVNSSYSFIILGFPVAISNILLGFNRLAILNFILTGLLAIFAKAINKTGSIKHWLLLVVALLIRYGIMVVYDIQSFGVEISKVSVIMYIIQFAVTIIVVIIGRLIVKTIRKGEKDGSK